MVEGWGGEGDFLNLLFAKRICVVASKIGGFSLNGCSKERDESEKFGIFSRTRGLNKNYNKVN